MKKVRNDEVDIPDMPRPTNAEVVLEVVKKRSTDVGSKYHRTIIDTEGNTMPGKVDVYSVCDAFTIANPALQHAIKKVLCAGIRNKGNFKQDIDEAIESLQQSFRFYKTDGEGL